MLGVADGVADHDGGGVSDCSKSTLLGTPSSSWSTLLCSKELASVRIDSCVHSLRCDSGGDDSGGADGTDFGREPGFFRHDFSGSLVGVDAPDLDLRFSVVGGACFGDGSLGVTFDELFREEAFHDDLLESSRGVDMLFVTFPGIPTKLEAPCGGILESQLKEIESSHTL